MPTDRFAFFEGDQAMDQSQLISVFCERPQNFGWFLGAGASRTAGLPTASDILWDLKCRHFCREENEDISRQDVQLEAVRSRIQAFLHSKGFPAEWEPGEYSVYFEKIFGSDRERQRAYLSAILSEDKVTLSVGNRTLAALIAANLSRVAFTTNFDTVVERAFAEVCGRSLSAFHIEGARAATAALNSEEFPLYCKLHGDFRYDSVKNLSADLAAQDADLARAFKIASARFGFLVVGFSGRDESVMSLFHAALEQENAFPHGLYWTGIKGDAVQRPISALVDAAKARGVRAEYIEIETFDALMVRLWRNLPTRPPELDAKVRRHQQSVASIPLPLAGTGKPVLRLNALPVSRLPTLCQRVAFARAKDWADISEAMRRSDGKVLMTKDEAVLAWGAEDDVRGAFSDVVSVEIEDLQPRLGQLEDETQLKGFLEQGITAALIRDKPLLRRGTRTDVFAIVDARADQAAFEALTRVVGAVHGRVDGLIAPADEFHSRSEEVRWAEAIRISLEVRGECCWVILDPDVWIWPPRARRMAVDFLSQRSSDRFNSKYNDLLEAWSRLLVGSGDEVSIAPFPSGRPHENPEFLIGTRSVFSQRTTA